MMDILYSIFDYIGHVAPFYWSARWAGIDEINPNYLNNYVENWLIVREAER